jgi:hypothetical protein
MGHFHKDVDSKIARTSSAPPLNMDGLNKNTVQRVSASQPLP